MQVPWRLIENRSQSFRSARGFREPRQYLRSRRGRNFVLSFHKAD